MEKTRKPYQQDSEAMQLLFRFLDRKQGEVHPEQWGECPYATLSQSVGKQTNNLIHCQAITVSSNVKCTKNVMHVQSGCFGCRSLDVAVVVSFNRDFTILQRQRQRERLELNRFIWAKQQLCRCNTLFCTFLSRPGTTTTRNDQILRWLENGNGKAMNVTICLWNRALSPLFSSNLTTLPLSNWVTWCKSEKVSKEAKSIFSQRFHWCRLCRIVRPIIGGLSNNDNKSENITRKMNLRRFKLYRAYLEPLNSSNLGDFFFFFRRLSTSSTKRRIGRFHVVVMQYSSKKCTKKRDGRAELLFCS